MRAIVLDTETTGLSSKSGDRIIEIGCVEIIDRIETGNIFHTYINPERLIPESATNIHGITNEQVSDKPVFAQIAQQFLDFIQNSKLIIHNANFDITFLNCELSKTRFNTLPATNVIDTLKLARQKFPGSSVSLDSLCKRFNISLQNRQYHGALLDSQLLTQVYLELTKSQQSTIRFTTTKNINHVQKKREARKFEVTAEEKQAHQDLLSKIQNPIWNTHNN